MSLTEEIKPYIDGYGLVAPNRVAPGTLRSCDNGVMYLSEYVLLALDNDETVDIPRYCRTISECWNSEGNLCRAPNDSGQEGPDDHYAVFAACKNIAITFIPKVILTAMFSNWGFANNERPGTIRKRDGKINWEAFLVRQPQLVAAGLSAAEMTAWWMFPLYWFTALVIATSCMFAPKSDTDARRLCWLLIRTVCHDSWMCRFAAEIWFWRLEKHYGPEGMKKVARLYYEPGHPFIRYWQTC